MPRVTVTRAANRSLDPRGVNWPRLLLRLLGRRLPRHAGRLRVDGLDAAVTIHRDRWGIPHVEASTAHDAWFALGVCHAQDRGFQLEVLRRVGRGTLAELVGSAGVPVDRLSRRLGFGRMADAQLPLLDPAVRAAVDAYVTGIEAGQGHGLRGRPHELALLRARPVAWQASDVLTFAALQSFALSGNWDIELARLKVVITDGPEALAALDPAYPSWHPLTAPVGAEAGAALDRVAGDVAALLAAAPLGGGGSNAWAIGGARTASGKPILANDPHLATRLPAPWYLAHLTTPEWAVAGASFVGGPVFPIGHNGFAAWGITAGLTDATDLFIEQLGPDGRTVREGDEYVACTIIDERIAVAGAEPIDEEVVVTRHGPIISPILDQVGHVLSLRATWLQALPVAGFFEAMRARSFEDFRRPFAAWPGPSLNVAYADADGHIGWQLVGQLPRRRRGNGTFPQPGWDLGAGWHPDLVPFEEMPCLADPAEGFLATANNQPVADGDGPFLGVDWIDGYRQARILESLGSRRDWTVATTQELQTDVASVPWREIRDFVLSLPVADDEEARRGMALLAEWDGRLTADSAAASVYEALCAELSQRTARAKAPAAWPWILGAGFGSVVNRSMFAAREAGRLVRLLRAQPTGWFARPWPAECADALGDAVRSLSQRFGADPAGWQWGACRPLILHHLVGDRPPLGRIFNLGPVSIGGDTHTVAQAGTDPLEPFGGVGVVPNTRVAIDLGDLEASRFVLAGGQSGNPLSPNYADLFALWRRGEGVPIPWSADAARRVARVTLRLEPRLTR